jgi:hypothetical protein
MRARTPRTTVSRSLQRVLASGSGICFGGNAGGGLLTEAHVGPRLARCWCRARARSGRRRPGTPPSPHYLVVKQNNNGLTFIVSDGPINWLLEYCDQHAEVRGRDIGAWEHTTRSDLRDTHLGTEPATISSSTDEMPFACSAGSP